MKYPTFVVLAAFAAQSGAQGISAQGTAQDGVTAEGETYNGTGTVQDSYADGDIKVIDVLESDVEVKDCGRNSLLCHDGGFVARELEASA